MGVLDDVPRTWSFASLAELRPHHATYAAFALDRQPEVPSLTDLSWLELEPTQEGEATIGGNGLFTVETLRERTEGLALELPATLVAFAGRSDLQCKIRSCTSCYLDLADFAAPTSIPGGWLVHVLSDQQWCRHWLLYLDTAGNECMVTSTAPIGFVLGPDSGEEPVPDPVPLDGTLDVAVCAGSFVEFLYRFWVENEIWYALRSDGRLDGRLASYAESFQPLDDPNGNPES